MRVINDNVAVITDARRAHRRSEIAFAGQHMRQVGRAIGNGVDVEEQRAGNVRCFVFGPSASRRCGHVPRSVEDNEVIVCEPGGKRRRFDQGADSHGGRQLASNFCASASFAAP
ncbi:MAG: hypothetical protein R3C55_13950 [Parvularculaceae bacterium]